MPSFRRLFAACENRLLDMAHAGTLLTRQTAPIEAGAKATVPTDWYFLKQMFKGREFTRDDVILDVGCGTGRVLVFLARRYPEVRTIGIELNCEVAAQARNNLPARCEVITGDVTTHCPPEVTVFYLFNPFYGEVMRSFCRKVLNPKDAFTLLYAVPGNLAEMTDALSGDVEIKIHRVRSRLRALDREFAVLTKRKR